MAETPQINEPATPEPERGEDAKRPERGEVSAGKLRTAKASTESSAATGSA